MGSELWRGDAWSIPHCVGYHTLGSKGRKRATNVGLLVDYLGGQALVGRQASVTYPI